MGVEMVDSSSRQKATKNNMDKGVAGRSMVGYRCAVARESGAHETGSGWCVRASVVGAALVVAGRPGGAARTGRCCELGVEDGPYARCGSMKRVTSGVEQGDACVHLFYHIDSNTGVGAQQRGQRRLAAHTLLVCWMALWRLAIARGSGRSVVKASLEPGTNSGWSAN